MRKVVVLNRVSVDGFFAGPNGEIDWFVPDPEVDKAAHAGMSPDTLLLGRLTFQLFAGYWPHVASDPNAPEGARVMANELDQMNKIVFSKTLKKVDWINSRLVNSDPSKEVLELKKGNGPDITLFGSGSIIQQLARDGLIDEYLLVVTPVILGIGKRLFGSLDRTSLNLLEARSFSSKNVLLHYAWTGK
jgi:dihydrofolate reductase